MRRAGRIALNVLTVVSLLLCVGTVGLWVHAWWHPWRYQRQEWWPDECRYTIVQWYTGGWGFTGVWRRDVELDPTPADRDAFRRPVASWWSDDPGTGSGEPLLPPDARWWSRLGFGWSRSHDEQAEMRPTGDAPVTTATDEVVLDCPYWAPAIVTAVLPTVAAIRVRRRRRAAARARQNLCPRCRYDLTANVSGVCPECGTAVSPAVVAGERMGKPASEGGAAPEGRKGNPLGG